MIRLLDDDPFFQFRRSSLGGPFSFDYMTYINLKTDVKWKRSETRNGFYGKLYFGCA